MRERRLALLHGRYTLFYDARRRRPEKGCVLMYCTEHPIMAVLVLCFFFPPLTRLSLDPLDFFVWK